MTNRRWLTILSLAAAITPALPAETHCPGNVASVPLHVNRYQMIVAESVNHSSRNNFLLDTGPQVTMIDPLLAGKLHLSMRGSAVVAGAGFHADSSFAQVSLLEVGSHRLSTLLLTCDLQLPTSQTVALTNPANDRLAPAAAQHFVCNTGYSAQQCHEQMTVLGPLLEKYGAGHLGDWTWVLVKSQDWKAIQHLHGMDPDSPAFTVLNRRVTFFEEALVSAVPERRVELVRQWSLGMDDLLNLAVTHELGHALCSERNERKADAYGEQLRRGQALQCK